MHMRFTYKMQKITSTRVYYLFKYSINISLQMFLLLLFEGQKYIINKNKLNKTPLTIRTKSFFPYIADDIEKENIPKSAL